MRSRPGTGQLENALSELTIIVPPLTRLLSDQMNADRCAVFVYSADQQSTLALFRHGYDSAQERAHTWTDPMPPAEIPAERYILQHKQPLLRTTPEDFEHYPLLNPGQEVEEGRLTDVTVPLIWRGQVQGSACLWRRNDPIPFSQDEIDQLMELGRLVAMTIVFARSYEDERVQRQRIDSLLEVASIASSGKNLDEVLQVLADSVRSATGADICCLYIFDEQATEILRGYQAGMTGHEEATFEESQLLPVQDVPAEMRLKREQRPLIVRDFRNELAADTSLSDLMIEQGVAEALLLPIVWQDDFLGVIYSWYRGPGRHFSEIGIEIAEAIARQAGGVVSRARLEAMLQRQSRESEAILRIGESVLKSESLSPVLDEVAGALGELIPHSYACVTLLTPDSANLRVIREWGQDFLSILGSHIPVAESVSGAVVREGRLIATERLQDDPRSWKQVPQTEPLEFVMVAPLRFDQRILGTLLVGRAERRRFTHREEQLLTLLSQPAAAAIERVRSRDEMARRAERQAFLARIGDLLVSSENPKAVLPHIAELATRTVADGVVIGLAGWEFGSMHWVADAFDDSELAERLHRGLHNLDTQSLQDRLESLLVSNKEFALSVSTIGPEQKHLRDFLDDLGVRHLLVLPLFQSGRAPGVIVFMSRDESLPFREEEIQLGRIVSHRIGDALERQQIKQNHEGLLRISEALHAQADVDDLIRTISLELSGILPCNEMIIADVDPSRSEFHTQVYRRNGQEHTGREFFPLDEGICGEALTSRRPIMDNQADLRNTSVYGSHKERVFYRREGESALAAPLIVENDVIGVVFVNRTGHHRFTEVEFETFLLFAGLASAALDRTTLEQHNRDLYRASTEVLAAVVDAKDPTTLQHSRNVSHYSKLIAELIELSPEEVERIELAGLLHDVGKLGIPDRVLQKPGRLSEEEFELIKSHPDRGARILQRHPALEDLLPLVRHHHEHHDGGGYPAGLEGEEIPTGARIISVADAFDTITSERTYQRRRTPEEAMRELERCSGTQFHPELVHRFVARLREDPSLMRVREEADVGAVTRRN